MGKLFQDFSVNLKIMGISMMIIGAGMIIFCFIQLYPTKQNSPIVDLPEEYKAISKDINHPDTMLSYISNDTIHIYFKNQ